MLGLRRFVWPFTCASSALLVVCGWLIQAAAFPPPISAEKKLLRVPGEVYSAPTTQRTYSQLKRKNPLSPILVEIRLVPLEEAEELSTDALRAGEPLQIGLRREVPEPRSKQIPSASLTWEPAKDFGMITSLLVESPRAEAIRVAIALHGIPANTEIRFYSPRSPDQVFGPYEFSVLSTTKELPGTDPAPSPLWSPVIQGDQLAIEIYVPDAVATSQLELSLLQVSHLIRNPMGESPFDQSASAGGCHKNVACSEKWMRTADSVAMMVFEKPRGTFLCSGQLINDTDPSTTIYYFLTAAHCISKQKVANSAAFYWFYQRSRCKGGSMNSIYQTAGGAKLLYTSGPFLKKTSPDISFLLLRRPPPDGVSLSGWWARDPTSDYQRKVVGIHHPGGAAKKINKGEIIGFLRITPRDVFFTPPYTHYVIAWKKGAVEPGSSGSGLWRGKKWPDQYVMGVLTSGASGCQNREGPVAYGVLWEAYRKSAKLRRLLGPGSN